MEQRDPKQRIAAILEKANPLHGLMITGDKISHKKDIKTTRANGQPPVKPSLTDEHL